MATPVGRGRRTSYRHDDVNFEADQLGRESAEPILLGVGPPAHEDDVSLLDVTKLLEGLAQREWGSTIRRLPATGQETDSPRFASLRRGSERRGEEAAR